MFAGIEIGHAFGDLEEMALRPDRHEVATLSVT